MASNKLNSFRITVILVVFVILCYVDWSPSTTKRAKRSPIGTYSTPVFDKCLNNGDIAITFDNGPSETTEAILKTLKDNNIKATFHLSPSNVSKNVELAKKIMENGHVIGLFYDISKEQVKELSSEGLKNEIEKEAKIIKDALDVNPYFIRFSTGLESESNLVKVADELGFIITIGNIQIKGTDSPSTLASSYINKIEDNYNVEQKVYPKFIDSNQEGLINVSEAWEEIAPKLKKYNIKPVTLDVCFGIKEQYRSNTFGNSKSASNSKAIYSFSTIILSIFLVTFFLL
ncbi:glycoside hydrolase/deacetylase [Anaeromyces robustus]|uniref:Glycoside hydrolase/deacetylase n=1 Tax=Anaeromyces robustus TaxID=1754192 RepID=A0A1Y1X5W8_9FUNG|nr:glycoside hydrolase/deacetylase [Anaeromyces robustus]|eukprot:ORX81193.1 glycoside hydrolase/deacetylase [Anaeromyces robustus]